MMAGKNLPNELMREYNSRPYKIVTITQLFREKKDEIISDEDSYKRVNNMCNLGLHVKVLFII